MGDFIPRKELTKKGPVARGTVQDGGGYFYRTRGSSSASTNNNSVWTQNQSTRSEVRFTPEQSAKSNRLTEIDRSPNITPEMAQEALQLATELYTAKNMPVPSYIKEKYNNIINPPKVQEDYSFLFENDPIEKELYSKGMISTSMQERINSYGAK